MCVPERNPQAKLKQSSTCQDVYNTGSMRNIYDVLGRVNSDLSFVLKEIGNGGNLQGWLTLFPITYAG